MALTIDDIRALALSLPRSYEALVRDRVKFRVGRCVAHGRAEAGGDGAPRLTQTVRSVDPVHRGAHCARIAR